MILRMSWLSPKARLAGFMILQENTQTRLHFTLHIKFTVKCKIYTFRNGRQVTVATTPTDVPCRTTRTHNIPSTSAAPTGSARPSMPRDSGEMAPRRPSPLALPLAPESPPRPTPLPSGPATPQPHAKRSSRPASPVSEALVSGDGECGSARVCRCSPTVRFYS